MSPNLMIVILINREETARDTREKHYVETQNAQKKDSYVKTKAEIGVILPEVKEHLWLSEAGNGKERFFPRSFRGSVVLWSSPSGLQKFKRIHFCSFKPSSLWHFVKAYAFL